MDKKQLLGVFLWLLVLFLMMPLSGLSLKQLINVPAALFVALGTLGAVMFARPQKNAGALKFLAAAYGAWYSGILVSATGFVAVLGNLANPSDVGPNLAVALTSFIYGTAVCMVCRLLALGSDATDIKTD